MKKYFSQYINNSTTVLHRIKKKKKKCSKRHFYSYVPLVLTFTLLLEYVYKTIRMKTEVENIIKNIHAVFFKI